jgi:hypothetical protein
VLASASPKRSRSNAALASLQASLQICFAWLSNRQRRHIELRRKVQHIEHRASGAYRAAEGGIFTHTCAKFGNFQK